MERQLEIGVLTHKAFSFSVKEVEDQPNLGIIRGYASTFGNKDRVGDVFEPGAFSNSLQELRAKNLSLPMLAVHNSGDVLGGFDPMKMREDAKGLFVEGQFDFSVKKAREFYSLAKNGYINSFSIGFSARPNGLEIVVNDNGSDSFIFKDVDIFEASLVPVPANERAQITMVKSVGAKTNLPLASEDVPWSSDEAIKRVRDFTNSEDAPSASYRRAFMVFDEDNADNFTAYRLPFADVINGELKAVPRALFAIVAVLNGARGGIDIPSDDRKRIEDIIDSYYVKMGRDKPFEKSYNVELSRLSLYNTLLKLKRLNYERTISH